MYRFIRSASIKNAACMPAALQFAAEVTDYLNKQYALNMKLGVEALDQPMIVIAHPPVWAASMRGEH